MKWPVWNWYWHFDLEPRGVRSVCVQIMPTSWLFGIHVYAGEVELRIGPLSVHVSDWL